MLDSKDPKLQAYISGLPDMRKVLSQASKDHFNAVLDYLEALSIPFEYKSTLVRGLDYYTETVFEIVSENLGAQNSICGGGRYNNLIRDLGGPVVPAVGFAFGLERMALIIQEQQLCAEKKLPSIYFAPLSASYHLHVAQLTQKVRSCGIQSVCNYNQTSLSSHLKKANKLGCHYIVIIGEQEVSERTLLVKNLKTREQSLVSWPKLTAFFKEIYGL